MKTDRELQLFFIQIANQLCDEKGFISIISLLNFAQCDIAFRPLLVEALISKSKMTGDWVIFVNNEIHNVNEDTVYFESIAKPLTVRLRNTLAHEIAHLISIDKLGIDISTKAVSNQDKIDQIESIIEQTSPLLLISSNLVGKYLNKVSSAYSSHNSLIQLRDVSRVSSYVLLTAIIRLRKINLYTINNLGSLLDSCVGVFLWRSDEALEILPMFSIDNFGNSDRPKSLRFLFSKNSIWNVIQSNQNGSSRIRLNNSNIVEKQELEIYLEPKNFLNNRAGIFYISA